MSILNKIGKVFKKKPKARVGTLEDFKIETPEQKQARQFEDYIKQLTETARQRYGYDEEHAKKWAWQQVEKRLAKQREKGHPITCSVCKRYGSNAKTGPMVKVVDEKGIYKINDKGEIEYKHQNC